MSGIVDYSESSFAAASLHRSGCVCPVCVAARTVSCIDDSDDDGICPVCGSGVAHPWGHADHPNGYVDACSRTCALNMMRRLEWVQ